ncbi:MAG: hypothetical protein Q9217_000664 [Psora testacea]
MALIDYSESEGSDQEAAAKPALAPTKPQSTTNKPSFQKLVDSSNPHKIRVKINEPTSQNEKEADSGLEPPTKRAKIGGDGLSDFNSLLPAPKRAATTNAWARGGLGRGVSLKTGSTPGFTRDHMPLEDNIQRHDEESTSKVGLSAPETRGATDREENTKHNNIPIGASSDQPKRKSTIFKPLSVARKPQKKKPPQAQQPTTLAKESTTGIEIHKDLAPRISLFSTNLATEDLKETESASGSSYQPMLYQSADSAPPLSVPRAPHEMEPSEEIHQVPSVDDAAPSRPQSLDIIAETLNLSASAKRQLLGRNASKADSPAVNVISFSTDEEYAANEALRQAGETVQHNPVRAIAPGKHSLKQLVNVATMQKDALEESFAEGRRNKKEVGGRYGW